MILSRYRCSYQNVLPKDATDTLVNVTSSDASIVEVLSNSGTRVRISAKRPGNATLTFSSNDGNAEVVAAISVIIQVIDVTLSGNTDEPLMLGETLPLTATVLPADATDKSLTWSSSNNDIATVEAGLIRQVGDGEVTITATSNSNPSVSDSVVINVSNTPREDRVEVYAEDGISTIGIGKTAGTVQLHAAVFPETANQAVTWSVDDDSVATINSNGLLTAVSAGQVIVTATSSTGITGYIGITVEQLPTSISISGNNIVNVGDSIILTATVSPGNTKNKGVHWNTNDTNLVTVDEATGEVTGLAEGPAVILAKADADETVLGFFAVNVVILPSSVSILEPESTELDIGDLLLLEAVIDPDNASNKSVAWSTSDSSVATVSNGGAVTAVGRGSVQITATTVNGKTDSITLTVRQPFTLIFDANGGTMEPESWTCYYGVEIGGTLPTPTRDCYTFAGWYTSPDGGNYVSARTKLFCSDTYTVYAHWSPIRPTSIELKATSWWINIGEQTTITATVKPDNAADKSITWSSSDTSVATVSDNGVVTGVAMGMASITATAAGANNVSKSMTIEVRQPYTLYFDPNGGSCDVPSRIAYSGISVETTDSTYGYFPKPTKTSSSGYRLNFRGWYTSASGGTRVTPQTVFISDTSVTIYAQWIDMGFGCEGGGCGDNVIWWKVGEELFISGSGPMDDFDNYGTSNYNYGPGTRTPWHSSSLWDQYGFSKVTIQPGVTYVGTDMCWRAMDLVSVTLPSSVTSIGFGAFESCPKLESVTLTSRVASIDDRAFYDSPNVVFHCPPGSYAESYAIAHGIDVVYE